MAPKPQWISTMSMNRFYDHCYLIECAYHIISKYCCSFTNLLNHDDGSIPYYLVQKVKIAVEYGKMLLNTRYRPFQQQLQLLGSFDYIDQFQYEGLCIHWNMIKTETQIVEMYFNQISLFIYPVVSSNALISLNVVENGNVPALTKINALIQSLVGHDEATICSPSSSASWSILKNADKVRAKVSEEELGLFIVNNIIEPLFRDDAESSPQNLDYPKKTPASLTSCSNLKEKKGMGVVDKRKHIRRAYVIDADKMAMKIKYEFPLVTSRPNVFVNDLYNLIGNNLFRMDDKLLSEISVNRFESFTLCKNNYSNVAKKYGKSDLYKRDKDRRSDENNFRPRYDYNRRSSYQRKYQKRSAINFDKAYPCSTNFESANKKMREPETSAKGFI